MATKYLIQLVPIMQELSQESVRIAFTYAALNELDVCMADIRNAYLKSPTSQKHYIICGPKFGMENIGKVAIMHRAVYGGNPSQHYMYAKSKLVYTVQEMNENKAIEDTEDEETGRMLES